MPPAWDRIEAITFDAGGTLLYTHPSVGHIYAAVMARHGVHLPPDTLEGAFETSFGEAIARPRLEPPGSVSDRLWWHRVVADTLERLDCPADDFDRLFDELWETFANPASWRLYDEATETLDTLARRGYRLALLSNWDDRLRNLIAGLGIASCFEVQIISCEVGAEKPDRRIFTAAEEALDLPGRSLLHIGDSVHHDFNGAIQAGWHCLLINHSARLDPRQPSIAHFRQLLDLLPDRNRER